MELRARLSIPRLTFLKNGISKLKWFQRLLWVAWRSLVTYGLDSILGLLIRSLIMNQDLDRDDYLKRLERIKSDNIICAILN